VARHRPKETTRERQAGRSLNIGLRRDELAGARVVVRCGKCAGLFNEELGALGPCPHCHSFERGGA
jgi:Zn finger protein HypA/HybF involved in hydrogenase expression